MHIELVETLRCPRTHEESWLVGSFDRMVGRHVEEGRLGCPVCRAEYPIARGVVRFAESGGAGAPEPAHAAGWPADEETEGALRLAALLSLAEGSGIAVLGGAWARLAAEIAAMVADVHLLLLNGDRRGGGASEGDERLSAIEAPARLPVAAGAMRGVALDPTTTQPSLLGDAVRALRPGGRLVAPVGVAVPAGVVELARDEVVWVAERRETPRLVRLTRGQ